MDQSTIPNAQENRNDPPHQRSPPRHPRIPCKLWMRDDPQLGMRRHPGIVTDETFREDSTRLWYLERTRTTKPVPISLGKGLK